MKSFKAMPKNILLIPLTLTLLTVSGAALAVNSNHVQVIVNGTVGSSSCSVVGGPSMTVDLGVATPSILNSSNSAWVWKQFSIGLENCPMGMSKATITFTGQPDPNNPLYYKNTAVATEGVSVADNVAIQLAPQVGEKYLSTGTQMTTGVNSTTHQAQFDVQARMITPMGGATTGKVAGHIEYSVEYQ
ncbi:fimbrial protein [Buttiauxella selenatireducens]|uniref:Fimbrial protein n=1 Tax=Buttiauxella selenatireducens TaxID=3073902 RepID=A0ABY9SDJ8_9ENTR|nr:fimbrial protein [Buttiauxella sp. R73]WMY75572.1 fimbrial protein [Buttiauxella sp. R73]